MTKRDQEINKTARKIAVGSVMTGISSGVYDGLIRDAGKIDGVREGLKNLGGKTLRGAVIGGTIGGLAGLGYRYIAKHPRKKR